MKKILLSLAILLFSSVVMAGDGSYYKKVMLDDGTGNPIEFARFANNGILTVSNSGTGVDGSLALYSEQGVTDYTLTLSPNAAMTANTTLYLPAARAGAESFLKMGTDGIIDYDTATYEPAQTKGNLTATSPIVLDQTRQVIGGAAVISHATTAGNIHIPAAGASTQLLQYTAAGTAKWITMSSDASIADGGAVTVADDSHNHTSTTISGIDISADTNLAVTTPVTLTGDSIGMVNQGTTTTVLHGNAAGNPAFSAVTYSDVTAMTSANFAPLITDETGTGKVVLDTSPILTTPTLGVATATTLDTGQGANELYDMDENVQTTDSPYFAKLGIGATPTHYIHSAPTVNSSAAYGVAGIVTPSTLQDGSASTGTDEALDNAYEAIKFTASDNHTIGTLALRLKVDVVLTGSTTYIRPYLYSNSAGVPGTLLATGSDIKVGALTTSYVIYYPGFSYTAVSGTDYWIVLRKVGTHVGTIIYTDSVNTGTAKHAYSAAGLSWTTENNKTGYFKLLGKASYGVFGNSYDQPGLYGISQSQPGVKGASVYNAGGSLSSAHNAGLVASSIYSYGAQISSNQSLPLYVYANPTTGNTVVEVMRCSRLTTGTAADGEGASQNWYIEDSAGVSELIGKFGYIMTDVTTGHETGDLFWYSRNDGATSAEHLRLTGIGDLQVSGFVRSGDGFKRITTQFDKTNTTLAYATGLTAPVISGKTYQFEVVLFVDADVVGGTRYKLDGSATATSIIYEVILTDNTTNANTITSRITDLGTSSAGQAGTTAGICVIKGLITVNAGGTFRVYFAQNAASGTSSVLVGSYMMLHEII